MIGRIGTWCAVFFAAVSAAALPPVFSVGPEGGIRIGDSVEFEWMAYQNWRPSFQKSEAMKPAVGFPTLSPERFELEAEWQLLDEVKCRFSETV